MTASCTLCGQVIQGALIPHGPNVPLIGDDGRAAIEYQAVIMAMVAHLAEHHGEYYQTLTATAQTYLIHLVAKLASSADPRFDSEREDARALVYWTLVGRLEPKDRNPLQPAIV